MSQNYLTVHKCPGGHKIMESTKNPPPPLYLVDQSGESPESCDDGPLLIRRDRPVTISMTPHGSYEVTVDVKAENNGGEYKSNISIATALYLARAEGFRVAFSVRGVSVSAADLRVLLGLAKVGGSDG